MSSQQHTQQFLSTLLSQRGPSALPYAEEEKWLIRQQVVSLGSTYPSLQPKTAIFTHNDGRSVTLLQASGTLPIQYSGVTYNIPIILWLQESYPRQAPLVFLDPTRDMIIRRHHPFVDTSGRVSIPYIDNWLYPSSNLLELARNLSHFFGRDPPLYSRPNTPVIPPRPYPTEDPADVFKRNAINKLVENLHSDVATMRKGREGEMEALFTAQGVLRQREGELGKGLREMQEEKERLERYLQRVSTNAHVLEAWLGENQNKIEVLRTVDVDDAFQHCDALSRQMFECTASDLAMEDLIYGLDKAVQDGAIPFDQYLRNVRIISREQFIHRATASKVRAAQMQAQVSNMASRAPPYAL